MVTRFPESASKGNKSRVIRIQYTHCASAERRLCLARFLDLGGQSDMNAKDPPSNALKISRSWMSQALIDIAVDF